ncbi:hypothetical protein Mgra_00007960 [Meloidogyne graminicola]|uniref:Uncharacterized protein n=1 Tax=Meloidogyne graminicola TaxID=189291 RepID=A0A8S9ZH58_9BILA|nr:hypothetical protein Mgra_00007960 [Meloidogyne graminicola]
MCQCIQNRRCSTDIQCSLLKGACDKRTNRCNCEAAYRAAGFASLIEARRKFCFKKTCTKATEEEDCIGMSCGYGFCRC